MATGLNRSRLLVATVSVAAATLLLVVEGTAQQSVHTIPADQMQPLVPAPVSPQGTDDLNCIFDCGNSDGQSDTWGYICELEAYQAWFGFDVSSIPDSETITSMSFTAYLENLESADVERSLWYAGEDGWIDAATCPGTPPVGELVATLVHVPLAASWETFDIDLSQHDWQTDLADDRVSLMVSGPTSGEHYCGTIRFMESEDMSFLTVVTEAPVSVMPVLGLALLLLALSGAALLAWKR